MSEISTIKQRILQYLEYKGISKYDFYKKTGVSNGVLSQKGGLSEDNIFKFISYYVEVDPEWLLTGKGPMLRDDKRVAKPAPLGKGIPLIPVEAFAGASLNDDYAIDFDAIEERYHVPLFDGKGVDFMMYVRGSSMYPKYSSGDVVACRFVRELLFIQWNKVYVIDTRTQGAIIKRLLPGSDPDKIICRSDNREYIDFEVPMSDIRNIALVVGCIRLE